MREPSESRTFDQDVCTVRPSFVRISRSSHPGSRASMCARTIARYAGSG